MRCRRANFFGKLKYKTMTPEQKKNIKLGASYLRPISAEDIRRRDEWIENQLPQVLDLALAQDYELERLRKLPDLIALVSEWGRQKGITGEGGKGTLKGQAEKMMEEATETMDAVSKYVAFKTYHEKSDVMDDIIDGVGDTIVTLILLSDLLGVPFAQCLQAAYDEIKGRTGKMVDGVFVREKDGGKSESSTLGMP